MMELIADAAVIFAEYAQKDVEDLDDTDAESYIEYLNEIATDSRDGKI